MRSALRHCARSFAWPGHTAVLCMRPHSAPQELAEDLKHGSQRDVLLRQAIAKFR